MITPLNSRVIIKRSNVETKSAGGIVMPESEHEKPTTGIVIAVAEDYKQFVETGDTVLFSQYSGTEVKVNGEEVLIMKFEDLIARIG